jgi:hypothetical protein
MVDRWSVGQSVLVSSTHLEPKTRFLLLSDSCGFVDVGRVLWYENGSVVYNCSWPSPAKLFLRSSPAGLISIFYCIRFENLPPGGPDPRMYNPQEQGGPVMPQALDSLFVASYNSLGYRGGHLWLTPDVSYYNISVSYCCRGNMLVSNGRCIFTNLAVVVQQRVYKSHCF